MRRCSTPRGSPPRADAVGDPRLSLRGGRVDIRMQRGPDGSTSPLSVRTALRPPDNEC